MKYLLSLFFLLSISPLIGMTQPSKKLKPREPVIKKIWRLQDFDQAVRENKVLILEDYLETKKPHPLTLCKQLHNALEANATGSVALLLHYGVPVDLPDKTMCTPLMKMAALGNLRMVAWLRIFKANPKIGHKGLASDEDDDNDNITPFDLVNYIIGIALENDQQEAAQHYNKVFDALKLSSYTLKRRGYKVEVPKELYEEEEESKEDATMTDIT
jgi:hypothetical protein